MKLSKKDSSLLRVSQKFPKFFSENFLNNDLKKEENAQKIENIEKTQNDPTIH